MSRAGATQRPPLYDGRSSWDAYITQFEMLAQLNRWTEVEKATLLAVSLTGAAMTVLSNLSADRRSDYIQGIGDSPRESFWDGAPSTAPENEAQEPNPKARGVSCRAHGGH